MRGDSKQHAIGPSPSLARCRRVALAAQVGIGVMLAGALALSVGAFLGFRAMARQWQLQCDGFDCQRAALDEQEVSSSAGDAGSPNPLPPLEAVIAEALNWEPPLAHGPPTVLDSNAALPIATGDHVLGSQLAPITLMLFGDLQCREALHALRRLLRRVQEQPAEYRLVWRERPLDVHADAETMAMAAESLAVQYGEVAFWRYVRGVSMLKGSATPSDVAAIADALRKQPPKFSDAAAHDKAQVRMQSDQRIAIAYAIRETPTLFINGLRVDGDFNESDLDDAIEEEREAVEQLLLDPVPRAKVYATRVHANLLDLDLD